MSARDAGPPQPLAAELSGGRVDPPAYPEVALRVRQVLADEHVMNERIARVLAVHAAGLHDQPELLDTTLVRMPSYQRLGLDIAELHRAVQDGAEDIASLRTALGE